MIDSTTLSNGVHTISWGVTDNAGNAEGIGSRYFTVLNGADRIVGHRREELEHAVGDGTGARGPDVGRDRRFDRGTGSITPVAAGQSDARLSAEPGSTRPRRSISWRQTPPA